MSKTKRSRGRPTREETLIHKIEQAALEINERSADIMFEMFQILEAVARSDKATDASRMNAAKYIIQRAEDYIEEESKSEDVSSSEVEDFNQPLISTSYKESKTLN